jgi:hypothetical protein
MRILLIDAKALFVRRTERSTLRIQAIRRDRAKRLQEAIEWQTTARPNSRARSNKTGAQLDRRCDPPHCARNALPPSFFRSHAFKDSSPLDHVSTYD